MIIDIENGNLFSLPADCIVNPVNCMGISGKGLALQFKEIYKNNFINYKDYCTKGLLNPGGVFFFKEELENLWIANMATKYNWRYPSSYIWIEQGLINLRNGMNERNICSVGITKIGCGLGGLSWTNVKPLIYKVFENTGLIVFICE